MDKEITYKLFGNKAILIEWEAIINEEILEDILFFQEKLRTLNHKKYVDFIIAYHSLTLVFKNDIKDFNKEVIFLKEIYASKKIKVPSKNYIYEIPVCYSEKFGIDLRDISKKTGLKIDEIIAIHSKATYKVHFIGFLPGFMYLGGLNNQLYIDRKPNPRLHVGKGSVAIGGKQTGVYPTKSAGGWNIIGKTPINFFDANITNPCFVKAGDSIKFKPISLEEFYQIEDKIDKKSFSISKILCNA